MLTVNRNSKPFSKEEHEKISIELRKIYVSIRVIAGVMGGKSRAKWIDKVLDLFRKGTLMELRSNLDDDWYSQYQGKSPYFVGENEL